MGNPLLHLLFTQRIALWIRTVQFMIFLVCLLLWVGSITLDWWLVLWRLWSVASRWLQKGDDRIVTFGVEDFLSTSIPFFSMLWWTCGLRALDRLKFPTSRGLLLTILWDLLCSFLKSASCSFYDKYPSFLCVLVGLELEMVVFEEISYSDCEVSVGTKPGMWHRNYTVFKPFYNHYIWATFSFLTPFPCHVSWMLCCLHPLFFCLWLWLQSL